MEERIRVFGTSWCPDCWRAKRFLDERNVPYDWIDIEGNPDAQAYVQRLNNGKRIVPTIVFPDGSILAEPSNAELAASLSTEDWSAPGPLR